MTSKERMLTALNLGKPDRVPATVHQWQPYHLKYFMGGMSDIEAFRDVGLDAAITCFPVKDTPSASWKVTTSEKHEKDHTQIEQIIETPEGNLSCRYGRNEITAWNLEDLIKNDDDIYLIKKYRPIPVLDKKALGQKYDEVGDDGIIRTFTIGAQGGCWQDACELYGTERMIFAAFDKPDWVHEFLGILLEQKLEFIYNNLKGARADLIETGGGASSNNVISPAIHEEFCLPYDRKIHDAFRSIGHKTVYHTCGGMTKLLDLILRNGCDASETLSPKGMGGDITNPSEVADKFSGRIAMIGGLDQFNVLTDGDPGSITGEVFRLFEGFGQNGGYIMSASDHFFHTPRENLIAYAKAAQQCTY